jgi:glycerol-3-phosphate dehydrogenase (NAD(P)+)
MRQDKVAVIGGGSWGTALAFLVSRRGGPVVQWARDKYLVSEIQERRQNPIYMMGFEYPDNLQATNELSEAVRNAKYIISVTPSHTVRQVMNDCVPHLDPEAIIISASKGIEQGSLSLMSEVLRDVLPKSFEHRLSFLAGPSFAKEVAEKKPTAVVVAAEGQAIADQVQQLFSVENMLVYTTQDVIGAELGGALKNVIAIAAGIGEGMELGANAQAAIITRGIAEIGRLAVKLGGDILTLAGLAGIGDLSLTCTGKLSRNRTFGYELGRGKTRQEIERSMRQVAEGVRTAKSAYELAVKNQVDMPITDQVFRVLYEDLPARQALKNLMSRVVHKEF